MKVYIILFLAIFNTVNSCRILSLSGGGSHGAFEAGVVDHLVNNGVKWNVIAGVSAGSLNAAFVGRYDNFKNATEHLKNIWCDLKNSDVYKIHLNKLNILDSEPLKNTINKNLELTQYNSSIFPTLIGMTNIQNGKFQIENILKLTDITDILMASSAIPIVFAPVKVNDAYFIDGGTDCDEIISQGINYCLNSKESDITMDLILSYNPNMKFNNKPPTNIIEYLEGVLKIVYNNYNDMTYKLLNVCLNSKKIADVNLYYPSENIETSLLDFNHGVDLYNLGIDSFKLEKYEYC